MPLPIETVQQMIEEALPGAVVEIKDLAGDNDHYEATVKAPQFKGKSMVQQHQMVYAAFKGQMGTTLHALALNTEAL
ncbi:MAG: BolA/IbaG family iron-sulfur metabolism protein [Alphaproteobacteria bacterium]|nr:BolA/IbaG family iron-sulfur metabolism protein [Alphaproteobacteria bacterium]